MTRDQLHGAPLPEGYEQRTTQQGQVYFLHTQTGVSSWHDPRVPQNMTHINPDELGPLPDGWELRSSATGRLYYVDHSSRTTQFTDPRLGRYMGQLRNNDQGELLRCPSYLTTVFLVGFDVSTKSALTLNISCNALLYSTSFDNFFINLTSSRVKFVKLPSKLFVTLTLCSVHKMFCNRKCFCCFRSTQPGN